MAYLPAIILASFLSAEPVSARQQIPFGFFKQDTSNCAGISFGGYCWYFGSAGQSCDAVCTGHGSCDSAGIVAYGSSGTNTDCANLLDALGVTSTAISNTGLAYGCVLYSGVRYRNTGATTCAGSFGTVSRACSCTN